MKNRENDIVVTIRCITYNHEPYIRQCLEGFVMQKTNFRFEAIVHDDASTDDTAKIIKEYAEKYPYIIKPIFEKENQYSKHDGSITRILNKYTKGKYIALCEGDDYWIDPFKLQKQVDFLESHPDYGLVYTSAKVLMQNTNKFIGSIGSDFKGIDALLMKSRIPTLTVCYRNTLFKQYYQDMTFDTRWLMGDLPIWLYMASKSKVHYIKDKTSVYRILNESASHSLNVDKRKNFLLSSFDVRFYFIKLLHKEYLMSEIGGYYFHQLYKLHIDNKLNFDCEYYKSKFKINSVPVKYRLLNFIYLMMSYAHIRKK